MDLPLLNIAQLFWRDVKVSPILIVGLSPPPTLWAFLRRLRWNKVKNCYTSEIYTCTGGLIRFYIVIWSVLSQFKWPLLFLHHRGRGRGTRLSIRSQDPNNSSDTERGPCLDRSALCALQIASLTAVALVVLCCHEKCLITSYVRFRPPTFFTRMSSSSDYSPWKSLWSRTQRKEKKPLRKKREQQLAFPR